MHAIRNYTNTKCELEMAKTRLNWLMDKKEKLYCKYFPITAKLKEVVVDSTNKNNDPMADYLHELTAIDPITGISLEDEIKEVQENINNLKHYIKLMEDTVKDLKGIEADLYKEIVINGVKISKAVSKIAEKYDKDNSTIWRLYHDTIKKDVKMLVK